MILLSPHCFAGSVNKVAAAGIFYLCGNEQTGNEAHFQNPVCAGLNYRIAWKSAEPQDGVYDWSSIDSMVNAAHDANKALGISVAAGIRCPAWLKDAGANMMTKSMVRKYQDNQTVTMPMVWDPVFQQKWGAFIEALGERYDGNPNVSYITISGMGVAFEPLVARTPEDIAAFKSMGGYPRWIQGSEQVIDMYSKAFPNTPFILAMQHPVPEADGDDAMQQVAEYGLKTYPGRFGIMFHGLSAQLNSTNPYARMISENSDSTTVGFQMVWSTKGAASTQLQGTLEQCLDQALILKGHFVEVYGVDCDSSQFTDELQQVNGQLLAQAKSRAK